MAAVRISAYSSCSPIRAPMDAIASTGTNGDTTNPRWVWLAGFLLSFKRTALTAMNISNVRYEVASARFSSGRETDKTIAAIAHAMIAMTGVRVLGWI